MLKPGPIRPRKRVRLTDSHSPTTMSQSPTSTCILYFPVEVIDEIVCSMGMKEALVFSCLSKQCRQIALRHIFRAVRLVSVKQARRFCKGIIEAHDWVPSVQSVKLAISLEPFTTRKPFCARRPVRLPTRTDCDRFLTLLSESLYRLPMLSDLIVKEVDQSTMHAFLNQSNFPSLRAFTYISCDDTNFYASPSIKFVLNHPLLVEVDLHIRDSFVSDLPPKSRTDDLCFSHLTSFSGSSSAVLQLINGPIPLVTASVSWDLPAYYAPERTVPAVFEALASSSAKTLVNLHCTVYTWFPDFMSILLCHLPGLESLSISQHMPRCDPVVKEELLTYLPTFKSLKSFSITTYFPAFRQCRKVYADYFKDIHDPIREACPKLASCVLYDSGENDLTGVFTMEGVDLTGVVALLAAH